MACDVICCDASTKFYNDTKISSIYVEADLREKGLNKCEEPAMFLVQPLNNLRDIKIHLCLHHFLLFAEERGKSEYDYGGGCEEQPLLIQYIGRST